MLDMRFRLPELMAERGIRSAYHLEQVAARRLSLSTCNRLVDAGHELKRIDVRTLQALCDVFDVDTNAILERDKAKRRG